VNDVIVCDGHFVMAHFDEALRASDRLWGVVLLDRAGGLELSYNDSFGGDVVDCYCACDAGRGRVLFLGYPGFSAVLLDVTKKQQRNWTAPTLVHGASAVTVARDTAFFFGSYEDRHRLARWRLGDANAEQIGTTTGPLRGLQGGRMLSKGTADYTVLSFDESPDDAAHYGRLTARHPLTGFGPYSAMDLRSRRGVASTYTRSAHTSRANRSIVRLRTNNYASRLRASGTRFAERIRIVARRIVHTSSVVVLIPVGPPEPGPCVSPARPPFFRADEAGRMLHG